MCFIIEIFGNSIKTISDRIMTIICFVTSIIGIILITAKNEKIYFIDHNLSWIETIMPLIVGTGGCTLYNIIWN